MVLSPGWRQAIIWTNAGILLIRPLATDFSEILITIETFSFKKMHLKMPSAKCRPFCLDLNVLKIIWIKSYFVLSLLSWSYNWTRDLQWEWPGMVNESPRYQRQWPFRGPRTHQPDDLSEVPGPEQQSYQCYSLGQVSAWALQQNIYQSILHTEAETKWPPFRGRHFYAFSWMRIYEFRLQFH